MAKYLITGGCGFIGSHLAHALVAIGAKVVILDDLSTGKREKAPVGSELIIGDIRDKKVLKKLVADVDGCFHLAAIASMTKSILNLSETHEVNLTGTVNLIEAVVATKKKIPIIYTTTSAVYGKAGPLPLKETTIPEPLSPYGVDKWCGEKHLKVAWELHGIPSFSFRLFNVYGPGQDALSPYSGVISLFAKQIREGNKLKIYGTGEQRRDFIHVSDVVAVFLNAIDCKKTGCFLFNLATGRAISVLELADLLEKIEGKRVGRDFAAPRNGDILLSLGDPAKAIEFFGKRPLITLEEGLKHLMSEKCVVSFCS